jgi:outer membrane immunogenic protein
MKQLLIGTVALTVLAAPAMAADLPARTYTKAPVYKAPEALYNWTGFYIGAQLGGAFAGNNSLSKGSRFLGGIDAGVNYQFATNWVVGGEVEFNGLAGGNSARIFPPNLSESAKNNELGSITGRVGYTWGPGLVYAKGGYAFRDNYNTMVTLAGVPTAFTTTGSKTDGYTVGAGLEYMFAPNWSAKGEYQYYNFGNTTFTAPAALRATTFRNDEHSVKVGVNYHFGWGNMMGTRY